MKAFHICLPPRNEQSQIASILSTLDDKIELNLLMNETLEEMARALFKSWFVDFDPVRAKIEGRQPAHMDNDTAALFPDRLDESGLPEGWSELGLDQIADFLNGLALQKYPATDENYLPVIKIAELRNGVTGKTDKASLDVPTKYVIGDGDLLFSWSGSLVLKVWTGGPGALNQHLFKVTSSRYSKWFYRLWTEHHLPEFQRIASSKVTTMGHIQRQHLTAARVIIPSTDVLSEAEATIAPLLERAYQNDLENRTLAGMRDLLLPKLMSGEIRVVDAAKALDEAASGDVVEFPVLKPPATKPKRKTPDQFMDALLISALVRGWGKPDFPLGNFRLQKGAYFVHRKAEHDIQAKFQKHAAGPYDPDMKYRGGIGIANRNGYVQEHASGRFKGLIAGDAIADIDKYLSRYDFADALPWVLDTLHYRTNDDLELLSTVDFAAQALRTDGKDINSDTIIAYIKAAPKWKPKLKKDIFSPPNIQRALKELARLFPDGKGA